MNEILRFVQKHDKNGLTQKNEMLRPFFLGHNTLQGLGSYPHIRTDNLSSCVYKLS